MPIKPFPAFAVGVVLVCLAKAQLPETSLNTRSQILTPAITQSSQAQPATPALEIPLWKEGTMPGPPAPEPPNLTVHQRNWKYTWVPSPGISIFRPAEAKGVLPAVLICPGGGYGVLAYTKEGTEIAAWLNSLGITGIVLKYRVPKCQEGALQDLQRAMRLVRANSTEWKIDPKRVGVVGFSAGGDLCVRLMAQGDSDSYPKQDATDQLRSQPDFAVLVYPAFYSHRGRVDPAGRVEADLMPTPKTAPTFIVHTEDDKSFVNGTKIFAKGLEAAGVRHQFLLFATGGHGYGLRLQDKPEDLKTWPEKAGGWLGEIGILPR